ncbi:uncharacterized protein B0T23DRAFT_195280 [Neurospora hispaniola]|uniref:Myb-like domain-containing protein n=1 Tax=Neurospora hispaniola TaxID=588809 RepID=A0AAJ0I3Q5_9PEZI|nr:hypothetical protein B0T23DRAFT_195280 [Neurospora hispaniola]
MTGRGRGRPGTRQQQPAEGTTVAVRRTMRLQQQSPPPTQGEQAEQHQLQQQQQQVQDAQIDPAITGAQESGMPPPPVPAPKGPSKDSEQAFVEVARRSTRRDARAGSMVSVNSVLTRVSGTDAISSQPETPSFALRRGTSTSFTGAPARGISIDTVSELGRTPARRGKERLLMSRMLPHLFASADKLFTLLATIHPQQRDPDEQAALEEEFEMYRLRYISNNSEPSINLKHVLSAMEVDPNSPVGSDACKTVTLANLATMFDRIDVIQQGKAEDGLADLQVCDDIIAQSLVVDGVENSALLKPEDIMTLVVEIRTLLFMLTLQNFEAQNQLPVSRSEILADTFCQGVPSVEAVEDFKQGNKDALPLRLVPGIDPNGDPWHKEGYITRLQSICGCLPNESIDDTALHACLEHIQKLYDPHTSLRAIRDSLDACFQEIKRQLQPVPPGPSYPATQYGAPDSSAEDSQIQSQLESESLAVTGQRQLNYLASLQKIPLESDSDASQAQDGGFSTTQDIFGRPHELPLSSYPPIGRAPYPPSFDAQQSPPLAYPSNPSAFQNGTLYAQSAAQLGRPKRASPSGNDGVVDGSDASKPPAKKPRTRRPRPAVPTPAAEGAMGDVGTPSSSAATAAAAVAAVARYSPSSGTKAEPDLDAVSQRSREVSAANRKARGPQSRSPWLRDDIRMLIKAVDTYKCKWSVIEGEIKKGNIPFERPRDQQALRDKARLLKQDFLKADAILPPSFDLVVLGKKEKEAVKACGKNPDRKEDDVRNGIPINTDYQAQEPMQEQASAAEAEDQAQVQGEEQPDMQLETQAEVQTEAQPEASAVVSAEVPVDAEAIEAASTS